MVEGFGLRDALDNEYELAHAHTLTRGTGPASAGVDCAR
jgi:hypothetical protein